MPGPFISLENCRSLPEMDIFYLQGGQVHPEFRNKSEFPVEINKVSCTFQTEAGLLPYEASVSMSRVLRPRELATFQIPFKVPLALTQFTNSYSILLSGRAQGTPFSNEFGRCGSLIIHNVRSSTRHFFVSHKDPENTPIARRLSHYLRKIGFIGFVAEDEKRPGLDLWTEKIIPAIDGCLAFVVLWSVEAATKPEKILRELGRAKQKSKRLLLLIEEGTDLPTAFPPTVEYIRVPAKIAEQDLIDLVTSAEEIYRTGGFGT